MSLKFNNAILKSVELKKNRWRKKRHDKNVSFSIKEITLQYIKNNLKPIIQLLVLKNEIWGTKYFWKCHNKKKCTFFDQTKFYFSTFIIEIFVEKTDLIKLKNNKRNKLKCSKKISKYDIFIGQNFML